MQNNYFNFFSNEDILLSNRNPKLNNIHSMKFKKVMALNQKKPILYKKIESQSKNKDDTSIKESLKSKHHLSSIRNIFNSFFRNSQSQEPYLQSKAHHQQNSTNQLSINININNINIQNYNVSTKRNKLTNVIKFPLVLKHNLMIPPFPKANCKLQINKKAKVNSLDSLSKRNLFQGEDNDNTNEGSLAFNMPQKSKVIDDNNDDSVIDELVDLLEKVERSNQTMKKEDAPVKSIGTICAKMTNQTRPQTSYGGLQLRQKQLQKRAPYRLPIK